MIGIYFAAAPHFISWRILYSAGFRRLFFCGISVLIHYFLLANRLVIIAMAGNIMPATTQMIQLYPQSFVERLYPRYIAVVISQYVAEITVVMGWVFFFSFE